MKIFTLFELLLSAEGRLGCQWLDWVSTEGFFFKLCSCTHKKRLASVFSTGTNNLLNALRLNSAIQLWLCMKLLCVYLCLGPTEASRTRCMAVMFKGGVTFPQSSLCRKQRMKKHLHCHLLGDFSGWISAVLLCQCVPCPVRMGCVCSPACAGRREMEPRLAPAGYSLPGPCLLPAMGSGEQWSRQRYGVLLLMSHEVEMCFNKLHGDAL